MQILTLAGLASSAWRNGGGRTRAIGAGSAAGTPAHPDGFDWRISLADIDTDGAFSTFAGLDRHALLIGKGAVELRGPSATLMARPLSPIAFPGELELHARRRGGTLEPRFLNLMVRRAALQGEIRILNQACRIDDALAWALLPLSGTWHVCSHQVEVGQVMLAQQDDMQARPQAADACAALVIVRLLS